MSRSIAIAALLYLQLCRAACGVNASVDFIDWSMSACASYPPCAMTFHLNANRINERVSFALQLQLLMFENDVTESIVCQSEYLWVRLMANFWPCSINEMYDIRLGCTCAKEKSCHERSPSEFGISVFVYIGIGAFVSCAIIYYGKKSISNQRQMFAYNNSQ